MSDRPQAAFLLLSLVLTVLLGFSSSAWSLDNQLKGHASPYLAMHGEDPVAWQDWNPSILDLAQKEGKLIFISSGYFSCHWCHVMQRESYSDPKIAALLNEYFIPVKIDRELNPALDAYLIDYVERTRGRAGWPLNIFLTPKGYPLVGTTYMRPKRFAAVLSQLRTAWREQRDEMQDLARKALLEMTADQPQKHKEQVSVEELQQRFIRQAMALGDSMEGGFGGQNKFPMAPQLYALLQLRDKHSSKDIDPLLILSLDQMAHQGLRDQLGGGFFRYTVDPSWHVPHFEKMLYTQAQLARVYLLAGKLYQRPDYLDVARDTLDFVLRDMRGAQGMFISSFSAVDAKGEEGAYYLWQPEVLDILLGEEDAKLARRYWAMLGTSAVDGGYLPRQGETAEQIADSLGEDVELVELRIRVIRDVLLDERRQRSLPADTKELAGWNGLLLGTLAIAGAQLNDTAYTKEALQLARQIKTRLWRDGRLWRARSGDQQMGQASLADYAYLAEGLGQLLRVVDDAEMRNWQKELVGLAWQKFHDQRGWRTAEEAPLPGMGSARAVQDGALPAPPAVLMTVTSALARGVEAGEAEKADAQAAPRVAEEPFWFATTLMALPVD